MSERTARIVILGIFFGVVLTAMSVWLWRRTPPNSNAPAPAGARSDSLVGMAQQLTELEEHERKIGETVYARDLLAERCGLVFEEFWDALNAATNRLQLAASLVNCPILPPRFDASERLPHAIELHRSAGAGPVWTPAEGRKLLEGLERAGWTLDRTEFRHQRFEVDAAGAPRRSTFYFSAHLTRERPANRAILEGDLGVEWTGGRAAEPPLIRQIDASGLILRTRAGPPAFTLERLDEVAPQERSHFIDPLIAYDLDGDGRPELMLVAANLVYRRRGAEWAAERLCAQPAELVGAAAVADFNGDGAADLLVANHEGLVLFPGPATGPFDGPGRPVWTPAQRLKFSQVITCGDVDGDGDLDVWLGQYKVPYKDGQMPTPFHDANDGHPAYLLLNDGQGRFTDATEAGGLAAKRARRSYSASFADLDGDGDLDLVVVSDFAGADVFANDGRGHFTDVTRAWLPEARGFGMAHALADFNGDGREDFLMIGMNSPTASRLEALGIQRPGFEAHDQFRGAMTFGNRLYLRRADAGFEAAPFADAIARSGWTWGCGVADFDNDRFPDVYVANGHETQRSVRDYDPQFWKHDIYVGDSRGSVVKYAYFGKRIAETRGRGQSYGGYEKNRLYWNRAGGGFIEIAHLLGVALEEDCRNVVAEDLDGDGRCDLVVTTFEAWPRARKTVRIFRNTLGDAGHWIGFRLREQAGAPSPVGARVTLRTAAGAQVRSLVTGDSYRAQHAPGVHFGLGMETRVDAVEIRWSNGATRTIEAPAIDQWHRIDAPAR